MCSHEVNCLQRFECAHRYGHCTYICWLHDASPSAHLWRLEGFTRCDRGLSFLITKRVTTWIGLLGNNSFSNILCFCHVTIEKLQAPNKFTPLNLVNGTIGRAERTLEIFWEVLFIDEPTTMMMSALVAGSYFLQIINAGLGLISALSICALLWKQKSRRA